MEKRRKNVIVNFNPSARDSVILDRKELDYIDETIREAAMKFAKEEDKQLMIILMGIIRKKLREDPSFAGKLRELLGINKIFRSSRKLTVRRIIEKEFTEFKIG